MKIFTSLVFALVAIFANPAFATNLLPTPNVNAQDQNQGQDQGQLQGQLQGQGQAQGLINANNIGVSNRISNDVRNNANAFAAAQAGAKSNAQNLTNTLTVNEAAIPADTSVRYSGGYEVKNVPSFALGNVYPTAPCMGSSQVGGSGVGFSIGIGTSWTDDECGIRETARSFAGANLKEDALAILCTSKYAAAAPSCKARAKTEE